VLASVLGYGAVIALLDGLSDVMVGEVKGETVYTPFEQAFAQHLAINHNWVKIAKILAM
jgi:6-phosphofructokinase 1